MNTLASGSSNNQSDNEKRLNKPESAVQAPQLRCLNKLSERAHVKSARNFRAIATRVVDLAPVVQRVDNAIHRINRYPADKCWQNKLRYPLDSDSEAPEFSDEDKNLTGKV